MLLEFSSEYRHFRQQAAILIYVGLVKRSQNRFDHFTFLFDIRYTDYFYPGLVGLPFLASFPFLTHDGFFRGLEP